MGKNSLLLIALAVGAYMLLSKKSASGITISVPGSTGFTNYDPFV